MAVVSTKATAVSNRDSSPKVLNNARISKGAVQAFVGVIEGANGDSANSKYFFGTIPSNARMIALYLSCDGAGTNSAMDIGLYQTTANGGAVVDADCFASAQALGTALTHSNVMHESGVLGIEDLEKPIWEVLGLTADPKVDYDVIGTVTTALDAGDTLTLQGLYAI